MKIRDLTLKVVSLARKNPVAHTELQTLLEIEMEATTKEYHRTIENILIDCIKSGEDIFVAMVRITELKQTPK